MKQKSDNLKRNPKNKYNAKKVTVEVALNGEKVTCKCDSEKEARRLVELSLLNRAGKIQNVRTQVPYKLIPAAVRDDGTTEKSAKYIADFVYEQDGKTVVEDVKSEITRKKQEYVLKRKLMLFVYGLTIHEV